MEIPGSYKWLSKSSGDGGRQLPTRRTLLALAYAHLVQGQKAEVSNFDLSLLDESVVPVELFFVREHFPAPSVSSAGWRLSVAGAVDSPFEISYDELLNEARRSLPVTIECAENPVGGGLVSHAEWTGHSLATLLERARPKKTARFARLEGADGFARTIPVEKALHADTLIASGMNGGRLPVNHGFPLRAVVPGWYGMDSIKWLRRIELLEEPANQEYVRLTPSLLTGVRPAGPITAMNVKSAFCRPLDGAILVSRRLTVRGVAWAGEHRIRQVELSTDGGKSWRPVRLDSEPRPYAWVPWSYDWKVPAAGPHELTVRATDDQGREQPEQRPSDRVDDYESNAWQTVRVTAT